MQNEPTYESRDKDVNVKITDWKNEPTVLDLQDDLKIAQPSHDLHVSKVKKWMELRNIEGSTKPKTGKNRSKVQPKLVRRQNEWRYSALSEPFLSSEKLYDLAPVTWEDEKSARQNELVLNWQFRTKIDKVSFIDQLVRTDVDEGTVYVRTGWNRETVMEEVDAPVWEYTLAQDPMYLQQLQMAMQTMMKDPNGFLNLPEEMQEAATYSAENAVPVQARIIGTEKVKEEKVVKNHPTATIMDYENVYLDPACEDDVDKAGFCILSFETSHAELKKDGRYKNLDKVLWSSNTPLNQPDHASRLDGSVQFKDDLRKRVVAYEYWGFYDVYKTGELVPIVATWIGNVMIRMEENPYPDKKLPLVTIPYMPVRKSVNGEPDAELLEENQAILGAVTRGMIDLMGRAANGQTGFQKGLLDIVNRRKFEGGDDYEFNPSTHPKGGMHQHTFPEIPNSALTMLQLQNQEAEALSGVKAFSGGLSGETYGEVATGIRGMLDASSKREMSILRRLASGIEKIGRKFASMNAVFLSDEEIIRVTNDKEGFVKVRRDELAGEFDLIVDISTAEIDEAKAQDLAFMLQTMGNNMDFAMTQMILSEIARLKRMPALAKMIKDFQPQPDPLDQKLKELEIAKLEAELAEIQSKSMLNEARARKEASDADLKDLDFLETESGTKHARDVDKLGAQASANQDLEITKAILDPEDQGSKLSNVAGAITQKELSKQLTSVE